MGGVIGGYIGDKAAARYANHGRIFVVQFSVGMGPLFSFLLLKVLTLLQSTKRSAMCFDALGITDMFQRDICRKGYQY